MFLQELKKSTFFSHFTSAEIEEFINLNILNFKEYKKGDTIHNQGELCQRMDFLLTGSLVAYNLAENGSTIAVFNFLPNSALGCNLLFSELNRYPLNIYCTSHCHIAYINKENIAKLLSTNHIFTMEFIKAISNYSINMNTKMLSFSNKTLRERILSFIYKEVSKQNSNTIKLLITKKQLADELGVQRPSLFRELKKMADEEIISYDSNTITLL